MGLAAEVAKSFLQTGLIDDEESALKHAEYILDPQGSLEYERWRHGGWYVHGVKYPSGAVGCVSNNYNDKKWRIVCDSRRGDLNEPGDYTFGSREEAARAEKALAIKAWSDYVLDRLASVQRLTNSQTTDDPMRVSLDGGETFVVAPQGVRVVYADVMVPGEADGGSLHVNLTHEGIVSDLWTTREEPLDHNVGTRAEMLDDLVSQLVDGPTVQDSDSVDRSVTFRALVCASSHVEAADLALEYIRSDVNEFGDGFASDEQSGVWTAVQTLKAPDLSQDAAYFKVEFEISVTANGPQEAFSYALDDLRDRQLGPVFATVVEPGGGRSWDNVEVGAQAQVERQRQG